MTNSTIHVYSRGETKGNLGRSSPSNFEWDVGVQELVLINTHPIEPRGPGRDNRWACAAPAVWVCVCVCVCVCVNEREIHTDGECANVPVTSSLEAWWYWHVLCCLSLRLKGDECVSLFSTWNCPSVLCIFGHFMTIPLKQRFKRYGLWVNILDPHEWITFTSPMNRCYIAFVQLLYYWLIEFEDTRWFHSFLLWPQVLPSNKYSLCSQAESERLFFAHIAHSPVFTLHVNLHIPLAQFDPI